MKPHETRDEQIEESQVAKPEEIEEFLAEHLKLCAPLTEKEIAHLVDQAPHGNDFDETVEWIRDGAGAAGLLGEILRLRAERDAIDALIVEACSGKPDGDISPEAVALRTRFVKSWKRVTVKESP